jgi:hypothetical protein
MAQGPPCLAVLEPPLGSASGPRPIRGVPRELAKLSTGSDSR